MRRRQRRQQRVAVGLGGVDRLGADIAAGAAAVLDHERLAEPLLKPGREDSRHGVDAAAGRFADDDLDRPIGIIGGRILLCGAGDIASSTAAISGECISTFKSPCQRRDPYTEIPIVLRCNVAHRVRRAVNATRGNNGTRWDRTNALAFRASAAVASPAHADLHLATARTVPRPRREHETNHRARARLQPRLRRCARADAV